MPAGNPWTAATAYPTNIIEYGFAQVGQDMYVISGIANGARVDVMRRYNATTNVWTLRANIPVASEAPAAASFGGKIYVADGFNGANQFRIYDIATNTWSVGPARPGVAESFGAGAGAFNGNVYVVGGGLPSTTTLSVYNITSNSWGVGPAAPSPYVYRGLHANRAVSLPDWQFHKQRCWINTTVSMRLDMATNTWSIRSGLDAPARKLRPCRRR